MKYESGYIYNKEYEMFNYGLDLTVWHDLYVDYNFAFDKKNAIKKMLIDSDKRLQSLGWWE